MFEGRGHPPISLWGPLPRAYPLSPWGALGGPWTRVRFLFQISFLKKFFRLKFPKKAFSFPIWLKPQKKFLAEFFPNVDYSGNRSNKLDGIISFIIGFCGKLYPVMVIEKRVGRLNEKVKEIVYDIDLMREYSDNYISKWHGNFDDFLNLLNNKDILNIFQDNKVPCFILKESKVNYFNRNYAPSNNLILNPCLKDLEFYKIMDSASAFQEIEMYISGVIGCSENKIIEVSDKSKIEGHGFDYKKSFRKEKEKK